MPITYHSSRKQVLNFLKSHMACRATCTPSGHLREKKASRRSSRRQRALKQGCLSRGFSSSFIGPKIKGQHLQAQECDASAQPHYCSKACLKIVHPTLSKDVLAADSPPHSLAQK